MTFHIASRMAFCDPKAIGWSSDSGDILSHEGPLTASQFAHLMNSGVLRSDEEIAAEDRRQAKEG